MSAHYGIAVILDAHKNAINVVFALLAGENPAQSENISQPASATGADPATHWFGGRQYTTAQLAIYQNIAGNLPAASWPVTGVTGAVTQAQANAAAAALVLSVTTQETYSTQQAQQTLSAVCDALGIQRVFEG